MGSVSEAPRPTILSGQWGSLRPLDSGRDAAGLYRLTHDERTTETWVEMKVGPFESEAAFRLHLDDLVADPTRAFYAIVSPADETLGWLCLMEVQPAHRTVELGYVMFAPPLQRTALATEAFYLIMSHVFDELKFDRLEWTCTATNLRSRKAAVRLGFQLEGVMRSKLILKGKAVDIPLYSMLGAEWPAVRRAMQQWLAPSNFVGGRQVEPLRGGAARVHERQLPLDARGATSDR
jgi:RimJ/RimL family protein N-acetyltransferase